MYTYEQSHLMYLVETAISMVPGEHNELFGVFIVGLPDWSEHLKHFFSRSMLVYSINYNYILLYEKEKGFHFFRYKVPTFLEYSTFIPFSAIKKISIHDFSIIGRLRFVFKTINAIEEKKYLLFYVSHHAYQSPGYSKNYYNFIKQVKLDKHLCNQ